MRALLDEFAAAARGLSRAPMFTALAVAVLGLGLGAVIGMVGIVETMLWKPPPYPGAERIYAIELNDPKIDKYSESVAPQDYVELREVQTKFEALGAGYTGTVYLTGDGQAERYDGGFVSASIFDVAATPPLLGRVIEPRDDVDGAAPVVVLGHDLWRTRFDADPGILGRTVRLNGVTTEVVGVMPKGFAFPVQNQLWIPARIDPGRASRADSIPVQVIGRLHVDATPDEAQEEFAPVAAKLAAADTQGLWSGQFELRPVAAAWIGHEGSQIFGTMLAAVAFVLLIACANVSNLLLARSAYRIRETSVRAALGANRTRLVIHVLAEGLFISLLAALVGLLLASLSLDAMRLAVARLIENTPSWWAFEMDARVVATAVGLALLSTLLAGLPAALRASRPSLDAVLRDGGRTGTGLAIGRITWALVVLEVALACVLLGGAALMTRSVLEATRSDVGVNAAEIMTARAGLPVDSAYKEEADQIRFWENFVGNLERQPGVEAATATAGLPRHGGNWMGWLDVAGRDDGDPRTRPMAFSVAVSHQFFDTFRLRPLRGRLLDGSDRADTLPVAVVNESLARLVSPEGSPIGARIRPGSDDPDAPWLTIVGVVPDVVHDDDGQMLAAFYVPVTQKPARFMSLAVRGPGDPRDLAPAMRAALLATDPDLALYWVRTLDEAMFLKTAGFRIIGTMFIVFAVIALVLASAGLFGVLAFHVGQRTREIGVRRALGANDGRILDLVMKASGSQVLAGVAIGMALLPVLGRGLGVMLLDMSPYHPGIYAGVMAAMLVVAALATLAPTRRALRIDPAAALRYE